MLFVRPFFCWRLKLDVFLKSNIAFDLALACYFFRMASSEQKSMSVIAAKCAKCGKDAANDAKNAKQTIAVSTKAGFEN